MAIKRRSLFLYLAIACFFGILAIFVFDGYVGIHDTVVVTAEERPNEIDPEFWEGQNGRYDYPYYISATWGEPVQFRYEIDNRRFSSYSAVVEASLWKSNEKVLDLFNQNVSIPSFDEVTLEWALPAEELENAGFRIGEYTVKLKRGEVELGEGIILSFRSPEESVPKPPAPVR
ncbi:hypothetical protein ACFLV3_06980 [Chloroflexota bacterium]